METDSSGLIKPLTLLKDRESEEMKIVSGIISALSLPHFFLMRRPTASPITAITAPAAIDSIDVLATVVVNVAVVV